MHAYVHFWYILKIVLKKSYLRFSFSNFRIKVAANALDREATPNTVELVTFTWWSKSLEPNPREYTTLLSLTTEMARAGLFRHFIVFSIISVISFESALLSARARALVVQRTIKTRKEYPNILLLNVLRIENAHAIFFLKFFISVHLSLWPLYCLIGNDCSQWIQVREIYRKIRYLLPIQYDRYLSTKKSAHSFIL